jgi:hypothetical protein
MGKRGWFNDVLKEKGLKVGKGDGLRVGKGGWVKRGGEKGEGLRVGKGKD